MARFARADPYSEGNAMKDFTWEDVERSFGEIGSELHFSPNGPEAPTVAVLSHDWGDGLVVEMQVPTSGDEARDAAAFIDAVARETEDTSDERMADVIGIDHNDPDMMAAYHGEMVTARSVYYAWGETAWELTVD